MKKQYAEKEHAHGTTFIFGLLFLIVFFVIAWNNNYYDKQIENLPHKICYNESYIDKEPIMEQVECPCWKTMYCLMWCGNVTGYKEINKTREICDIK